MSFWFRKKYGLPPTDPRFLDMTPDEIEVEYYAHYYFENPKALEADEDEDFDLDEVLASMGEDDWEPLN